MQTIIKCPKPDGAAEKKVDGNLGAIKLGWTPKTILDDGVQNTIDWFVEHYNQIK